MAWSTSLTPYPNTHQYYQETLAKARIIKPYTRSLEPNLQELGPKKIVQSAIKNIKANRWLVVALRVS